MLAMSATAISHMMSERTTPKKMPRNTSIASVMRSADHKALKQSEFLGVTPMNTLWPLNPAEAAYAADLGVARRLFAGGAKRSPCLQGERFVGVWQRTLGVTWLTADTSHAYG